MVPTLCGSARGKMNNWLITLFPPCAGDYFHPKKLPCIRQSQQALTEMCVFV